MAKTTFKNFAEFWHLTKSLTQSQQQQLWSSMSRRERRKLDISFHKGGWNDLFMRNVIDECVNEVKEHTGIDLFDIRIQINHGKTFQFNIKFFEYIRDVFAEYRPDTLEYVFGGIEFEESDDRNWVIARKIGH